MLDLSSPPSWIRAACDSGIGRPIIPDPVPGLVLDAVPRDYRSHSITPDLLGYGSLDELRDRVDAALRAEDERLRRMLPPAPSGCEWKGQIGWIDEFDHHADTYLLTSSLRLRYRLVPIREGVGDG